MFIEDNLRHGVQKFQENVFSHEGALNEKRSVYVWFLWIPEWLRKDRRERASAFRPGFTRGLVSKTT